MKILFPCSDLVKGILEYWSDISSFVNENVKSWRNLKINTILAFSQEIADDFFQRFTENVEVEIIKDKFYNSWGVVGIEIENRYTWYFPYNLIQIAAFGITLDDILGKFARQEFVDFAVFRDIIANLSNNISVDFKRREIEFIKAVVELTLEKEGESIGIPSFTELASCLGVSSTQIRNYWKNLDKFFGTGILINYGKIGLKPVLVRHERQLTSLEKQYTMYSFHDRNHFYSLLLIPCTSSWVETNEFGGNDFESLGNVQRMSTGWNLTHLTEKSSSRWGPYPGILGSHLRKNPDYLIEFDCTNIVEGLHAKDFRILNSLSIVFDRAKNSSKELGVSESYFSQRMSFLLRNHLCYPRINLRNCGIDAILFIILHSRKGWEDRTSSIIERVNNSLVYFPFSTIYQGNSSLLALIKMPSKWMNEFLLEFQDLTERGGILYENGVIAITHHGLTRNTYVNRMNNLHELVVSRNADNKPGRLSIDWSFEIPLTST